MWVRDRYPWIRIDFRGKIDHKVIEINGSDCRSNGNGGRFAGIGTRGKSIRGIVNNIRGRDGSEDWSDSSSLRSGLESAEILSVETYPRETAERGLVES